MEEVFQSITPNAPNQIRVKGYNIPNKPRGNHPPVKRKMVFLKERSDRETFRKSQFTRATPTLLAR
jgi:hypothetical protein